MTSLKSITPYKVKSFGLATDLFISSFESEVTERENYLVIKTPDQPGNFWGNFILFKNPPGAGDADTWMSIYRHEFKCKAPKFFAFKWDISRLNLEKIKPFLEKGFHIHHDLVLSVEKIKKPGHYNNLLQIKMIKTAKEWCQVVDVHLDEEWKRSPHSQKEFMQKKVEVFRKFSREKLGCRFGAFKNNKLVGELGIYCHKDVGRLNLIATHRNYRRQGVCQTLLYEAAKYAFDIMKLKHLVVIADRDYHAKKIYKTLGFKLKEKLSALLWYDNKHFYQSELFYNF
ncbi:GNAT family N-acetyltransferase [Candidatus Riflebacteria bacterium]